MNLKEYAALTIVTESTRDDTPLTRLKHAAIGFVSEAGELVGAMKKVKIYGQELNRANLLEELGDLTWYAGIAIDATAMDIEKVEEGIIVAKGVEENDIPPFETLCMIVASNASDIADTVYDEMFESECLLAVRSPEIIAIFYSRVTMMFYLVQTLAEQNGFTIEQVYDTNIAKLKLRYADKYTAHAAEHRDLAGEEALLATAAAA